MNEIDRGREAGYHRQFRRWDLNLVVALDALLAEDGSVTRAAGRLAIGQSAMSHALSRLRELFDDPLFVRNGSGLVPTERARELAPAVAAWLDGAVRLLGQPEAFELSKVRLAMHLALPESIERLIVPRLVQHLYQVAPGIDVLGHAYPVVETLGALDRGAVDIALVIGAVTARDWHVVERIGRTPYLQIYNPQLVSRPAPLTVADLVELPHLAASYSSPVTSPVDHYFDALGTPRHVSVVCTGISAVPDVIASRPVVAVFPSLILSDMVSSPELAIEPFAGGALSVNVFLIWHQRSQSSQAHRYVREWIAGALHSTGTLERAA